MYQHIIGNQILVGPKHINMYLHFKTLNSHMTRGVLESSLLSNDQDPVYIFSLFFNTYPQRLYKCFI